MLQKEDIYNRFFCLRLAVRRLRHCVWGLLPGPLPGAAASRPLGPAPPKEEGPFLAVLLRVIILAVSFLRPGLLLVNRPRRESYQVFDGEEDYNGDSDDG